MPRSKRVRPVNNNGIYHIIIKSISEVKLFKRDCDKKIYLDLIKKYQSIYKFKIYGYCLMTNHAHFIINTQGEDISKIMHDINTAFVRYFNLKYKRIGGLFYDRFKSKIVNTNKYLLTLSAYIHNNAIAIKSIRNCPERYEYSSLGVYLGLLKDKYEILDEEFILKSFGSDVKTARENYYKFVYICGEKKLQEVEIENIKANCDLSNKVINRGVNPNVVMEYVSKETQIERIFIETKNSKNANKAKSLAVLLIRCLCNLKHGEISKFIGNISETRISNLSSTAVELLKSEEKYKNITDHLIAEYTG